MIQPKQQLYLNKICHHAGCSIIRGDGITADRILHKDTVCRFPYYGRRWPTIKLSSNCLRSGCYVVKGTFCRRTKISSDIIQHNHCREVSADRLRLQRAVPRSPPFSWSDVVNNVPRKRW